MRKRRLGANGPEISVIGLGTWGLGGAGGFGLGAVDDTESIATIRHAVESGINWVDTAAVYGLGHSEEVVGRALAPMKIGEDVYIFTKGGQNWSGGTGALVRDLRPESIRSECEQSLKRLGVERIDLYQFHWPDAIGTAVEDSWATMIELIHQGKVRTTKTAGGHHRLSEAEVERVLAPHPATRARQDPPAATGLIVALSGRNRLRGFVEEVRTDGLMGQIRLRIGDQRLTAVITRDAINELKLRRGDDAVAIVKSTEVMIAKEAEQPRPSGRRGADRRRR